MNAFLSLKPGNYLCENSGKQNYRLQSGNDNVEAPFASRYRLQFFVRDRRGKAVFLDASQRMVVVRDSESGTSGAFIMTMVSDRAYTKARRGVDIGSRFHNDGNLADYSGLILYTSLSGAIVRADRYSGGSIQLWVSFQGVRSDGDLRERAAALAEVMGGTHVRRLASSARTRLWLKCLRTLIRTGCRQ